MKKPSRGRSCPVETSPRFEKNNVAFLKKEEVGQIEKEVETLNAKKDIILVFDENVICEAYQRKVSPFLLNGRKYSATIKDGEIVVLLPWGGEEIALFKEKGNIENFKEKDILLFWFDYERSSFCIAKKSDIMQRHALLQKAKRIQEMIATLRLRLACAKEALLREQFWARYSLPFHFTSAIKISLQGLSSSSAGNGRKRNTVVHLFLPDGLEIEEGAGIKRKKNSFLCSEQTGFHFGHSETAGLEIVTCKKCLKLMERYKISQNEDLGQ